MQMVINIQEDWYEEIKFCECVPDHLQDVIGLSIFSGIPLPKGHGRLIDADTIYIIDENFISQSDYVEAECAIDNAPTIIEADKEDEE